MCNSETFIRKSFLPISILNDKLLLKAIIGVILMVKTAINRSSTEPKEYEGNPM